MMKGTLLVRFLILACLSSLTSCAMYQQDFECPPPCGVPCTSVTDLESMIVETDQGPDLFLPDEESALARIRAVFLRKVWIADECSKGRYVYQAERANLP